MLRLATGKVCASHVARVVAFVTTDFGANARARPTAAPAVAATVSSPGGTEVPVVASDTTALTHRRSVAEAS